MTHHKKVVFVVANEGFQSIEFNIPKKLLEQSGVTVQTASNRLAPAIAKDGSTAHVNYLVKNIPLDEIDGVFIVGGPGTLENLDNAETYEMLKKAAEMNLKIGAICIAVRILAASGILEGKQATGWDGDNELSALLKQHGAYYKVQDVVLDDNILTATGPDAAREYGEQIISMLD
jgi:protease I